MWGLHQTDGFRHHPKDRGVVGRGQIDHVMVAEEVQPRTIEGGEDFRELLQCLVVGGRRNVMQAIAKVEQHRGASMSGLTLPLSPGLLF